MDEPELHLTCDVLVPDLAGWRRERMPAWPQTNAFELVPDWVCEVLSPSRGNARDFRSTSPDATRVILVEGGERILPTFPKALSQRASQSLRNMGVEIRTSTLVREIDDLGVTAGTERIDASPVLWAAGVRASDLGQRLGLPLERQGRVVVGGDCALTSHPDV